MTKLYIIDGPDRGHSFDLIGDSTSIGRGPENDIRINDHSISRNHLKILRKAAKYFVVDLQSKNGTFLDGKQISAGIEFEVQEGVPIIIGMNILCLGREGAEDLRLYLDLMNHCEELDGDGGIFIPERPVTTRANIELINKVSAALMEISNLNEVFEKVLDYIFSLLKRIDLGVIILFDSDTGEFTEVIYRLRNPDEDIDTIYSRPIVDRVIKDGYPVILSDPLAEEKSDFYDSLKLSKIKSVMCVPLISMSQIRGVIYVASIDKPYGFRKEDLSLLKALSSLAAIAIENAVH
ncbi:MAG: FHA domain-containing protein [Deltaproteobacteria bacterium]|nr:FHA domain-containing protein [Deltaproteobacteria bacterium]